MSRAATFQCVARNWLRAAPSVNVARPIARELGVRSPIFDAAFLCFTTSWISCNHPIGSFSEQGSGKNYALGREERRLGVLEKNPLGVLTYPAMLFFANWFTTNSKALGAPCM
jgi:hypothetical protein